MDKNTEGKDDKRNSGKKSKVKIQEEKAKEPEVEETPPPQAKTSVDDVGLGLDAEHSKRAGGWGWAGTKSVLDISRMSADVNVERRKSGPTFGTAPATEFDFSILHRPKDFMYDKDGTPIPVEREGGRDSLEREDKDRDVEKGEASWKWKRGQRDSAEKEKPEGREQKDETSLKDGHEERKESVPKDKQEKKDSFKTEGEKEPEKIKQQEKVKAPVEMVKEPAKEKAPETVKEPEKLKAPETMKEPEKMKAHEVLKQLETMKAFEKLKDQVKVKALETMKEPEKVKAPETTKEPEKVEASETMKEPGKVKAPETTQEPEKVKEPEKEKAPEEVKEHEKVKDPEKAKPLQKQKRATVAQSLPTVKPRPSTLKPAPASIKPSEKDSQYKAGTYQVLKPDKDDLQKLAALDVNKQKLQKPSSATTTKGKKLSSIKFQERKPPAPPSSPKPPPSVTAPPKPTVPPPPPPSPSPTPEPPPTLAPPPKLTIPPPVVPPKPEPPKVIPAPVEVKPFTKPLPRPAEPKVPPPPTLPGRDIPIAASDASMASTVMAAHSISRHRKHKPRPKAESADFDIEDELSTNLIEEGSALGSRASLSILDDIGARHPDDELLFSLTAKEEIVFRRSISEMRWEEEESVFDDTAGRSTDADSDMEATAAAILWERIGLKTLSVPTIVVNDRKISLGHLEPENESDEGDHEYEEEGKRREKKKYVFHRESEGGESDSDSDPTQTLLDLIEEAAEKRKKNDAEEDKRAAMHAKLWRRRLIVVVLLNFVMKFRRRFVTFCEMFIPIIVCGVVISGMIWNSAASVEALQAKVFDSVDTSQTMFDPFDKVGMEQIFTAFCSNQEYCTKDSDRHYYIVYSPSNNFTRDIMWRALKFIGLDKVHKNHKRTPTGKNTGIHKDNDIDDLEDHFDVSKLVGADNATEVERICRDHWSEVSKFDAESETDGSSHSERLRNKLKAQSRLVRHPIGIVFSMEGNLVGAERLKRIEIDKDIPHSLTYTIRTFFSELANTVEGFPFREHVVSKSRYTQGKRHIQSTPYLHTGVIALQTALDLAYAEKIVEKFEKLNPDMHVGNTKIRRKEFFDQFLLKPALKQFEYPTYKGPILKVKGWLSLVMGIIFSYLVGDIMVAQEVVHEQNSGSIELLKIHGMTTGMRWFANLIILCLIRAVTTLAMALTVHYQIAINTVAPFSSPLFLWLFLWMHACTNNCFNYFITSGLGVKKPELAGLVVVCVSFITMLSPLHLFMAGKFSRFFNITLCFFLPHWNLANGIYYYLRYEIYEEGLDWYDFPVLVDTENHLIIALPLSCNIFLYSTMFYLMLTIYMDHILPRQFSPRETWLFFCKAFIRRPASESQPTRPIPRSQKPSVYEVGPKYAAYGPRFRNVTVTDTHNKLTVLDNISLDIYEGEVTCIVGQIGSGKSDFLNVIAGVNVPSAGFVDVKGLRVHEYHDITNRYVSLCPERRLLIETLSVEDHIRLCCMLHGASYAKAKKQSIFLLKMFGLMSMRHHSFHGLTTNDIKKLMLAMALSKSPSVLLLDNPIDQLDSDSRFQFWKLLQELKPLRSIIVTCTTLEEAQLYGDRIAILSKGKLVCYGSPQYLRLAYGIGNVMTLEMKDGVQPDIWGIQQLIHDELLGARTTLLETKGVSLQANTVKFILPFGKFYGGVLEKVEDNMERFGILNILMSQPSLWALFVKIASHRGVEQVLAKREITMLRGADPDENEGLEVAVETPIPVRTERLNRGFCNIVGILVLKKYWYYRQKYFTFLFGYIPQIILVFSVVIHANLFLSHEPEGLSKVISTRMYENNLVVFRSADNEDTRKGWEEAFKTVLYEDDKSVKFEVFDYEDDLEAFLAQGVAHTRTHYKEQTIIAFSKDKEAHISYYSSNSIHSAAIASHVMMQAFLYAISPDREQHYSTVLVSHPFPQYTGSPAGSTQSNSCTILGLFLSLCLCLLSAPVLRMILTERNSKFKPLQRMTGVSSVIYWFSHGICDYVLYALLTVICWGLIIFLDNVGSQQFDGWEERLALLFIFGLWLCWAALPYTYVLGCLIPQKITGYGHYVLYHFLLGIIPKVVTYQFLRMFVHNFYSWLRYILYIFPPYSITSACVHFLHVVGDERWCRTADHNTCEMYANVTRLLETKKIPELFPVQGLAAYNISEAMAHFLINEITFNDVFRTCCRAYCEKAGTCHKDYSFFNLKSDEEIIVPHFQQDILALVVNGFIFWTLVILYEHDFVQNLYSFMLAKVCGNLERTVAQRDVKSYDDPEDVKEEHEKVDKMVEVEGNIDSEVYLVQNLTKFYMYTKGLDHVYFTVPINTVTGLLGLPNSGKTTLLEILTGIMAPSFGSIYKDNELFDGRARRHLMMRMGYCPQKPCMLHYLTGVQMLTVMGRLRGLSKRECEQHVMWWIQLFGLEDVANKKCSKYRKGQGQRLCCALALIGDTNMVIFDEPTSSMDNLERYIFWNVISRLPKFMNRTVLFSSINAEEVEHQSSKALLLESGNLVAVGQLTEIFKNNNLGMTLAIRYGVASYKKLTEYQKKVKVDKLKDHVIQYLSPCALMDEQEHLLIYHLKEQNLKLSRVYSVMEGAKVKFTSLLEHFQVFEPSLDDIILQSYRARTKRQSEEQGEEMNTASGREKANSTSVSDTSQKLSQ